jgi:hypothetical protein
MSLLIIYRGVEMIQRTTIFFLIGSISTFYPSMSLDEDAKQYNNFMHGADISACNTTLDVLVGTLNRYFNFIAKANSYLNLVPPSSFALLHKQSVSQDVAQNPQQIQELLEDLQYTIRSIHDIQNALEFNLDVYLQKLASFQKMRPLLDHQVKRTAEEFYKKIEDWKKSTIEQKGRINHCLFSLEGIIATRLEAFKKQIILYSFQ